MRSPREISINNSEISRNEVLARDLAAVELPLLDVENSLESVASDATGPLTTSSRIPFPDPQAWRTQFQESIRDVPTLLQRLQLDANIQLATTSIQESFPLLVTASFLARMKPGDPHDPLLRQVLPIAVENELTPGDALDAVGDLNSREHPGLLHKYQGRVLLILSPVCAIHCRYCFRRHYPYAQDPHTLEDWNKTFEAIAQDPSIHEVILSGGDPLMLSDRRLTEIFNRLEQIPHLTRIRIHSRLPIVLPDRVQRPLIEIMTNTRLQTWMVVHANHPHEIAGDCTEALRRLVTSGIPTLNQAVLLRGINDQVDVLEALCEKLINLGVQPYYLHQRDKVQGTGHFEVAMETGLKLIEELRLRLPGFAVPQYMQEIKGMGSKVEMKHSTFTHIN
jgi:EF-P beta-lysylation protein EpmB